MNATRVAGQQRRGKTLAVDDNPLRTELENSWRRVSPHATTVSALLVSGFVPLKVLRVVHGDVTTALAVAQYADKIAVLTGLLLLVAPLLLAVCFTGTVFVMVRALAAIRRIARSGSDSKTEVEAFALLRRLLRHAPFLAVEVWLLLALAPWGYATFTLVVVPVIALVVYRSQIKPKRDVTPPSWLTRRGPVALAALLSGLVALLALLVVDQPLTQALNDRVWLPAHLLTFKTGPAVVGYALKDDGAHLVVLEDRSRKVRVLSVGDVTTDQLCDSIPMVDSRSLWDLLDGKGRTAATSCHS